MFLHNLVNLTLSQTSSYARHFLQTATDFSHPIMNSTNQTCYVSIPVSGTNLVGHELRLKCGQFVSHLQVTANLCRSQHHCTVHSPQFRPPFFALPVKESLLAASPITSTLPDWLCNHINCYDVCDTYGIPKPISRFVLPIAGTMKKDASAVFSVAAVFYVTQASNVTLHLGQAVIVSASVIVAITILNSICADPRPISLLYALEWLNNRLQSGNSILSHIFCTAFLHHMCEEDLKKRKGGGEVLETSEETHSTAF
ncbi:Excitatory amino acid transporter [Echinococcus multilocularis]|uniref:Amino acid transporter n=1 Tax=Echinococcus multilocularis TaxID=6211 RepID=A0A068XY11_ECHMU|nr:Excitatory amino acid transporter [Echinococcus multilocularis]